MYGENKECVHDTDVKTILKSNIGNTVCGCVKNLTGMLNGHNHNREYDQLNILLAALVNSQHIFS
jgi:hypothetical protein